MKTGLVLEGGAKRGIYTAGVLDVFLEHGLMPDGVIGVSAGAIHGCSYVARQAGRSIRYNLNYGKDPRFMSFQSWLKTGNLVDVDFCYHELPEKLDVFDNDTFKMSSTAFYVTCSNVETGAPEYILCRDMLKEIDFLRASASLPIFSRIVDAGGKKLLDGGIADSIPLRAFQQLGYDKNIVVLTRPQGYRKKKTRGKWLARAVYRKYPAFVESICNRHRMYNQELDYIAKEEQDGSVLIIRPSVDLKIGRMEKDLGKVKAMYELGRNDALQKIEEIKAFWKK